MRKFVGIAVPLLLIAVGLLPASADDDALTLTRPGVDGVSPPKLKANQIMPYYPATARLTRASGSVVVAATVLKNGKVAAVDVLSSDTPSLGFEEAAVDAVSHWKFKPATKDGEPVDSYTLVRLHFAPPRGTSRDAFVGGHTFIAPEMALEAMLGRPRGVDPAAGMASTADDDVREVAIPQPRPGCSPGSKCLYDRRELERLEVERRDGGPVRPLAPPK